MTYKQYSAFTLIHSDVWGPCMDLTPNRKRWFINFIDDDTRLTWVYLMKTKFEVENIFKNYFQMIQTQFQEKIVFFQSDNGTEYFNEHLKQFFFLKMILFIKVLVSTLQKKWCGRIEI